jgi:GT2 family glycosyltransferase
MTTSILLLTWDRYDLMVKCVDKALSSAGVPFELIVCDNGSTDNRVFEYIASKNPKHFLRNKENIGYGGGANQMLLRMTTDYFVVLDNDIYLPDNWLKELVETHQKIPNSGYVGIHCVLNLPDEEVINGVRIRPTRNPFGIKFSSREVLDKVGYFNEEYSPYGCDDNDLFFRSHLSGFGNYYLADLRSEHLGTGSDDSGEYRDKKDEALKRSGLLLGQNMQKYMSTNNFYIPPPKRIEYD